MNAWGKGKGRSLDLVRGMILLLRSLVLSGESSQGGKNCNRFPFFLLFLSASLFLSGGHFQLYISFPLILVIHLLIIQVTIGMPVPSAILLNLL